MTTETSTYTYEDGERETVMLTRGRATPPGHALLKIYHSDGWTSDCYVNTAWLHDRLNDLGEPRPLAPDAMTAREHLDAAWDAAHVPEDGEFPVGAPILTRPRGTNRVIEGTSKGYGDTHWAERRLVDPPAPTRPEGAEELQRAMADLEMDDPAGFADLLAERNIRVVGEERS